MALQAGQGHPRPHPPQNGSTLQEPPHPEEEALNSLNTQLVLLVWVARAPGEMRAILTELVEVSES